MGARLAFYLNYTTVLNLAGCMELVSLRIKKGTSKSQVPRNTYLRLPDWFNSLF
jgi:hypothetical protein